jgi:hypothetical protein
MLNLVANSILQNCAKWWANFSYSMVGLEFRLGEFIWVNFELCEGWLNQDCGSRKIEECAEQLTLEQLSHRTRGRFELPEKGLGSEAGYSRVAKSHVGWMDSSGGDH